MYRASVKPTFRRASRRLPRGRPVRRHRQLPQRHRRHCRARPRPNHVLGRTLHNRHPPAHPPPSSLDRSHHRLEYLPPLRGGALPPRPACRQAGRRPVPPSHHRPPPPHPPKDRHHPLLTPLANALQSTLVVPQSICLPVHPTQSKSLPRTRYGAARWRAGGLAQRTRAIFIFLRGPTKAMGNPLRGGNPRPRPMASPQRLTATQPP